MGRLNRDCIITEKIDGTNAQVLITDAGQMYVGSRTRWITPEADNYGFAAWCLQWREELQKLGPGRHFGEWWGRGIQRGYGQDTRRFSLFNVQRWCLAGDEPQVIPSADPRIVKTQTRLPEVVGLVPVLYRGPFDTAKCRAVATLLRDSGSIAAPGYGNPEGIVCFHVAANVGFKMTLKDDDQPKGCS